MQLERRHVFYSGQVQGVGFRYTTLRVARGHDVTGWVRNLPDGRVELVAEGTAEELARFLSSVGSVLGGNIVDAQVQASPASGEFGRFGVRL
jgi:acylphosphatase